MTDFKTGVVELKDKAAELEKRADKLRNKHLRDVLRNAIGRLTDALGHPDMDLLADEEKRKEVEHEHKIADEEKRKEAEHELTGQAPFPGVTEHATEERQEPQDNRV